MRMRAVAAKATLKEAKETLRQAKHRRKLARMLAKRAKKDAKQAKANLAEVREALAKLEARATPRRQDTSRGKATRIKSARRPAARKKRAGTRTATEHSNSRSIAVPQDEPTLAPVESESISSDSATSAAETPANP
jgi:hypothetical protein